VLRTSFREDKKKPLDRDGQGAGVFLFGLFKTGKLDKKRGMGIKPCLFLEWGRLGIHSYFKMFLSLNLHVLHGQ
jgi:hypothetical protein